MLQLHTTRLLRLCKRGYIVYSMGNNGKNIDLMMTTRRELSKTDITADALLQVQKLIDSLSYKPVDPNNDKYGAKNIKHGKYKHEPELKIIKEPTHIAVKDLITVYKWQPCLCSMATFLPIFVEIIDNDRVLLEDVPRFDSLIYKVMGE